MRTLSPSTHTTDVTNLNGPGLLSRHSQGSLHGDQHTEIRHAGMCDTSAIQNLPVEVLGEIFRHCVEAEAGGWYASPDTRSAPLLLCQVCAYWRQVAISTPVLWSKFSAQSIRSLRSELIQLWLYRSQAHPLSFHIAQWGGECGPSYPSPGLLPHAHNIMKLFFPHFSRCYDLSIDLDDTLVLQLLSIPIKDKKSVESLTLDANICTKEFIDQIPDLIYSFANIRRLSMWEEDSDMMSESPLLTIPWSQLTHVELHFDVSVKIIAVILAQCVQIVELNVGSLNCDLALDASTPMLVPHLRLLEIGCCCLNDESGPGALCCTEELLQVLTLPALRQLRLCFDTECTTWGRVFFPEFLVRSGCPLECLEIFHYDLVEDDIIALLSLPHLQSLREIDLLSHHISDRTLDLLTYPSSGTGVLPNLESIGVSGCSTSDGKLADMVASRWSPNPTTQKISQLAKLEYDFHDCSSVERIPCHDEDHSRIGKFRADGLKSTFSGSCAACSRILGTFQISCDHVT